MKRLALAGLAALAGVAVVGAQQNPRFQTGTELTRVEVTVLDERTRQPVRGLTASDFEIRVDGRPQDVALVTEERMSRTSPGLPAPFVEASREVVDNTSKTDRIFVIVMNDGSGGNDPYDRAAGVKVAHRIIDELQDGDKAAVIFARDNRKAQDLTADRTLLRRAVDASEALRRPGETLPHPDC